MAASVVSAGEGRSSTASDGALDFGSASSTGVGAADDRGLVSPATVPAPEDTALSPPVFEAPPAPTVLVLRAALFTGVESRSPSIARRLVSRIWFRRLSSCLSYSAFRLRSISPARSVTARWISCSSGVRPSSPSTTSVNKTNGVSTGAAVSGAGRENAVAALVVAASGLAEVSSKLPPKNKKEPIRALAVTPEIEKPNQNGLRLVASGCA